ncbi:hypothetical protein TIFTF001_013918 [Ficus carica]|uniref:Uncharacterized protein n=1 Tax=Ficus carica TaxID=3494 RepID=A0AA88A4C0_FICCA|nr:hypothetical protein TIFTF001_013918 [Ficus carica]
MSDSTSTSGLKSSSASDLVDSSPLNERKLLSSRKLAREGEATAEGALRRRTLKKKNPRLEL